MDARQKAAQQRSKQAIEKVFSPEFRNRLDAIVSFGPLTPAVMETIVEKFILQLEAQLAERRVAITLEPEARAWLAEKGYDPVYGARPLARVIQTEVRDPLTDEILFGRLEGGGTVTIALKDGKLDFAFEAVGPAEDTGARAMRRDVGPTRRRRQCPTKSTRSPSRSSTAAGGRTRSDAGARRRQRVRVAQADLRRGARAEGRREGQADRRSTSTKYRQASSEFEETRLRLRREISKDIERAAARSSPSCSTSSTTSIAPSRRRGRSPSADALLQGVEHGAAAVSRASSKGSASSRSSRPTRAFDPPLHEAISTVPAASPDQDGRVVGVIRHGYRIGDDVLRPAAVASPKLRRGQSGSKT